MLNIKSNIHHVQNSTVIVHHLLYIEILDRLSLFEIEIDYWKYSFRI